LGVLVSPMSALSECRWLACAVPVRFSPDIATAAIGRPVGRVAPPPNSRERGNQGGRRHTPRLPHEHGTRPSRSRARQVALLLDSVRNMNPPLHCYLRLAASTGARRNQLLALRWCAVDEEHRALSSAGPSCRDRTPHTHLDQYAPHDQVELDRDTYDVLMEHRTSCEAAAAKTAEVELPATPSRSACAPTERRHGSRSG
jgi:hypothetical protein